MTRGVRDQFRLLRWYPRAWRDRYGEELLAYLHDRYPEGLSPRVRCSLAVGGLRERARYCGLTGDTVPPAERARAGTLLVLAAWAAFVFAGAGFAKFSEHFDSALPAGPGAHAVPDAAFTVILWTASATGLLALAGLALATPAFGRYLHNGGWPTIRGHVTRAAVTTAATVTVTLLMLIAAHHVTAAQRNGGLLWYAALFLAWGGLVALTMLLWTVAAVAAARQLTLSRRLLLAEAALAAAVSVGMLLMVAATVAWWSSMAARAPAFFGPGSAGAPGNLQILAIVGVMSVAAAAATFGALRAARTSSALLNV